MNITQYFRKALLISMSLCMLIILSGYLTSQIVKAENTNYIDGEEDYYDDDVYVYCESSQMTLIVGQEKTISVEIDDEYNTNNELVWQSSNPSIVSVDDHGTLTAKVKERQQ